MSSTETTTRERILDATWHLMEQSRGQGVRIEDIARAAKVSRQAVYLHFGNRTELLVATARYIDEVLHCEDRIREACQRHSGAWNLDAYIDFWGNYIPDIYGPAKALMVSRETDEAAAAAWNDRMQAMYDGCLRTIQCLAQNGVLAPDWDVTEAADFLSAALSIATWENLTIDRGWTNEQYIERIKQVLTAALVRAL